MRTLRALWCGSNALAAGLNTYFAFTATSTFLSWLCLSIALANVAVAGLSLKRK